MLLVGGGEGMGALEATVEQLDASLQGTAQVGGDVFFFLRNEHTASIAAHLEAVTATACACAAP